jgi:segregation and condensation protein B
MSWGIQNSFSTLERRNLSPIFHLTPFLQRKSPETSIRKYWLRTGSQLKSSEQVIDSVEQVNHFRSPKMARVEAALFISDTSVSPRKLVQLATLADQQESLELIDQLNRSYEEMGSAFHVERVATGYRMLTIPKVVPWLDKFHRRQSELKLSASAMETLTIIAYRQPVTRADIEVVRGVQCSEMLKQLLEKGLIRVAGEEDTLGRPYLYDTTRKFLEMFGLKNLKDMPMADQLREPASKIMKSGSKSIPENEIVVEETKEKQDAPENLDENQAA